MQSATETAFLASQLHLEFMGKERNAQKQQATVNGLGTTFSFYNRLNDKHYAATTTDILQPQYPAYCAMQYIDGTSAAVAYDGRDFKTFTVGFPLECIREMKTRESIFRGILAFLLK